MLSSLKQVPKLLSGQIIPNFASRIRTAFREFSFLLLGRMLLTKDSRIVDWYMCELSGVDCCLHFENSPFIPSEHFAIYTVNYEIFNIYNVMNTT